MNSRQVVGIVLAVIGGVLGVIGFAVWRAGTRALFADEGLAARTGALAMFLALYLVIGGVIFLVLGRKAGPTGSLGFAAGVRPLAETKTMFPVGSVLPLVGSALLLVSLSLPWFTFAGSSHQDFSGRTYDGVGVTSLLNVFGGGPYSLAAFVWLILVAVFGVTSTFVGRKFSWFGISGILALALYAILVYVLADLPNVQASVGFAYGFFSAVIGSALIETGARLKKPAAMIAPMRNPLSPGILFIVLGIVSNVGGVFAAAGGIVRDAYVWAMTFGGMMVVVGMVLLARPSLSSPARPSESG